MLKRDRCKLAVCSIALVFLIILLVFLLTRPIELPDIPAPYIIIEKDKTLELKCDKILEEIDKLQLQIKEMREELERKP